MTGVRTRGPSMSAGFADSTCMELRKSAMTKRKDKPTERVLCSGETQHQCPTCSVQLCARCNKAVEGTLQCEGMQGVAAQMHCHASEQRFLT